MALSTLNLGYGLYAENGYLPTDIGYPNPSDFSVYSKYKFTSGKPYYFYTVSQRSAGAFTLFALGNYLAPEYDSPALVSAPANGVGSGLVENADVTMNDSVTLGAIGLGFGADRLTVKGSVTLSLIGMDFDPGALFGCFQSESLFGINQSQAVSGGSSSLATNFGILLNGLDRKSTRLNSSHSSVSRMPSSA